MKRAGSGPVEDIPRHHSGGLPTVRYAPANITGSIPHTGTLGCSTDTGYNSKPGSSRAKLFYLHYTGRGHYSIGATASHPPHHKGWYRHYFNSAGALFPIL